MRPPARFSRRYIQNSVSVLALEKASIWFCVLWQGRLLPVKRWRDGQAAAHCLSREHPCGCSWVLWCYSSGELCSLPGEELQAIYQSPTDICSGTIIWVISCLILIPPAHSSERESAECRPTIPPPRSSVETHLCCKNKSAGSLT